MTVDNQTTFAMMLERPITALKIPEYCYVFTDLDQARVTSMLWRREHPEEWEELSAKDRLWYLARDAYFILISNKRYEAPRDALVEYKARYDTIPFLKDAQAYQKSSPRPRGGPRKPWWERCSMTS